MTSRFKTLALILLIIGGGGFSWLLIVKPLGAQSSTAEVLEPATNAHALSFDRGAAGLWQTLLALHTRASLLMVTAHPDDEDGGMLTYESRGQGARVTLLTLNRGEGGANVMSSDYFDALGLVRTEELLAADRFYDARQSFTRVCDYGFSKTKAEALDKWGHDRVLGDVVRVVRLTRPLVITSVFVGGRTDGHGNHQTAGQMAQEAFKAAGDPNMFPEQIREGLRPWAPLKDYARVPFARITPKGIYDYADSKYYPAQFQDYIHNKTLEGQLPTNVEIPEGQYDPILGLSFEQVARLGLGYQKSQNGGTGLPPAQAFSSPYYRFASSVETGEKESSFYDGIDASLGGIATLAQGGDTGFLKDGLTQINGLVEQAMRDFSPQHPEKIAGTLAEGLKATNALLEQVASSHLSNDSKYNVTHELRVKQAQFQQALAQSLGLSLLATVAPAQEPTGPFAMFFGTPETFQVAIPGQQFRVKVHAVNRSILPVELKKVSLVGPQGENWTFDPASASGGTLVNNEAKDIRFSVRVPDHAGFTRPYFSRPDIEQSYYEIIDPGDLNLPLAPYPLSARLEFTLNGVPFEMAQVVQSVDRVTGPGTVLQPLITGPAISVLISPRAGIVPLDSKSFTLNVTVHSNVKGPAKGSVRLDVPEGWQASTADFSTAKDGEDQTLTLRVTPGKLEEKPYTLMAVAEFNGQDFKEGYRAVGYPGLRPSNLYRPATYHTTGVNVKVAPGLNVGYIMGAGDDVPQSLENLGIKVHFLTATDLASGDLSRYNVILMGVRTYAVREDLKTYNGRILDYVKNGGVVIVQYNTPEFDNNYGPYPYSMTRNPEEVTDEQSKVVILEPQNPVFTWPNRITEKDFEGWVEERGSKFMKSWDSHYQALLVTHDPGQEPQKGGLLYTRYGKGVYIYNAYAFYRQLPEGVPGAYRLIANMISLASNPEIRGRMTSHGPARRPAPKKP